MYKLKLQSKKLAECVYLANRLVVELGIQNLNFQVEIFEFQIERPFYNCYLNEIFQTKLSKVHSLLHF